MEWKISKFGLGEMSFSARGPRAAHRILACLLDATGPRALVATSSRGHRVVVSIYGEGGMWGVRGKRIKEEKKP